MRQLKKFKKTCFAVKCLEAMSCSIVFFGLFLVTGAIGGCDAGLLPIGRAMVYIVIGFIVLIGGGLSAAWLHRCWEDDRGDDDE